MTAHVLEPTEAKEIAVVECIARRMIQHGHEAVAIITQENDM